MAKRAVNPHDANECHRPGHTEWIRWLDVGTHGWQLRASPLSVASTFFQAGYRRCPGVWIFTPATLAIGGDPRALPARAATPPERTHGHTGKSVRRRAARFALACRADPLSPNSIEHTEAVVAAALPVLKASGGRAFLLFTTLRALARHANVLAAAMEREGMSFPLLVQGEGSAVGIADAFSRDSATRCCLAARASGKARRRSRRGAVGGRHRQAAVRAARTIRCSPPGFESASRARAAIRSCDCQLPQAAISLKQGAGRLIRTETDRGVLMICDRRMVDKPYGRAHLAERCRRCGARANWPTWRRFSRRCRLER